MRYSPVTLKTAMWLKQLHVKISRLSDIRQILLFLLVNFLSATVMNYLSHLLTTDATTLDRPSFEGFWEEMVIVLIAGPILETLFFQCAVIETFKKKLRLTTVVLLSAVLFAATHTYHLMYVVYSFFCGLCLAYMYCLHSSKRKAFIMTAVAHASFNGLMFVLVRL